MMRDKKNKGKGGIFKINLKRKDGGGTPSVSSWNSKTQNKVIKGQDMISNKDQTDRNRDDISINTALYKEFGVVTTSEIPKDKSIKQDLSKTAAVPKLDLDQQQEEQKNEEVPKKDNDSKREILKVQIEQIKAQPYFGKDAHVSAGQKKILQTIFTSPKVERDFGGQFKQRMKIVRVSQPNQEEEKKKLSIYDILKQK